MKNEQIAKILAKSCYEPKREGSLEHAIQVFLEYSALPLDIDSYTKEQIEEYILIYLNERR